jgi:hypothetical protein
MPEWARAAEARLLAGRPLAIDRYWIDPAGIMVDGGLSPDPWQADLLRTIPPRVLLLCSRQSGKSATAAAMALRVALLEPPSLILLLSPTLRQSGTLFRDKVLPLWRALGRPVEATQLTALTMTLASGSSIVSLPGSEETIRGYSGVRLLVIDEAARVADDLYRSVRPMLAVSRGSLVALSSAYAKMGFFFDAWTGAEPWHRVKVTAYDCPRISKDFLEEERRALGQRWFEMEYLCEFGDAIDAVFREEDIRRALSHHDITPLFED